VRARAAAGGERSRLWAWWREIDNNLDAYAALRSTESAVVVFEPRPGPHRSWSHRRDKDGGGAGSSRWGGQRCAVGSVEVDRTGDKEYSVVRPYKDLPNRAAARSVDRPVSSRRRRGPVGRQARSIPEPGDRGHSYVARLTGI